MPIDPAPSSAGRPIEARLAEAGLPSLPRLAWLEVDLGVLTANVRSLRSLLPAGGTMGVVVKADGYGTGMVAAARAALRGGASALLVATLDEALGLRAAGLTARILVLYPVPPVVLPAAVAARLDLVVADDGSVEAMAALVSSDGTAGTGSGNQEPRVHLGIDSGMGRGGLAPEHAVAAAQKLLDAGLGALAGTWSHLATPEDPDTVAGQVERFEAALAALAGAGIDPGIRHLDATVGLLGGAGPTYDMVRVGLACYGVQPPEIAVPPAVAAIAASLRPVVGLSTRAATVASLPAGASVGYGGTWTADRPAVIATMPLGYADGWARAYARDSWGVVRGRRVPVVGRISSDALALDVTDVPGFTADDQVALLDPGDATAMTVHDLATLRDSIAWEVLDAFTPRLARVYTDGGRPVGVRYPDGETRFVAGW